MRIAIIGTGPTGIYSLASLCHQAGVRGVLGGDTAAGGGLDPQALELVLFEKGPQLGVGLPYSPQTTAKTMLANIASIEIPPLCQTYLDWMERQPVAKLRDYDIDPDQLDQRDFTPRLMLGEYFHDQIMAVIAAARAAGIRINHHTATEVLDLQAVDTGVAVICDPVQREAAFDRVVMATGHVFAKTDADEPADEPESEAAGEAGAPHFFPNPWSGLSDADIPAVRVGVMGTSLSAIDAAMAVAGQHGRFSRKAGKLSFQPDAQAKDRLRITLMSWTGILPEADFYCEIPYLPLQVMTPDALAQAAASPEPFDAGFRLFRDEISAADPAWADRIGLAALDAESFAQAYFKDRETHDPFDWAKRNLDEAEADKKAKRTVQWRYAILRMHEQFEELVPAFSKADRKRFDASLKTVFVDNYAAVPPESIRRLLALHAAGVIGILALGEDYKMEHHDQGTTITAKGERHEFDIFIDARGQQPMTTKELPFPTLRKDILAAGQELPRIGDDYRLTGVAGYEGRVYLAALPYLMRKQPFVQGIGACAEIGRIIALAETAAGADRGSR